MNNSMITASSSMGALQRKLDILAGNISNVNTVGYKRQNAVFEDILTSMQPHEEDFRLPGRQTPLGFTEGWGARLSSVQLDLSQGSLTPTENPNDVAIEGNALFQVQTNRNDWAYTRHGSFQLVPDSAGSGGRRLETADGLPVMNADKTEIIVPAGKNLTIAADGSMLAVNPDGTDPQSLGSIGLFAVEKPDLLRSVENNLYRADQANVVQQVAVMPEGLAVRQGFIEQSNVNMGDEMADLMLVQRAYQLSARALSSGEQMLGMANNLRG